MQSRSTTPDEAELDAMLPEQFEIALYATQIRTQKVIDACRAVLVDGMPTQESAEKYNVDQPSVSRATKVLREKWLQICADQEWDYLPLALPRSVMKMTLEFQREVLKRYSEQKSRRGARKKK